MTMQGEAIRLGIVGLGMAGGMMVNAAARHPFVVCAGAADPNEMLRGRFTNDHDITVYADIAELLAQQDIDAVYIATPHQRHHDHVVAAARAGKHVIIEKPMALTLAECDSMITAATENAVALIVGHTHSFDPAIAEMRRVILSGEVGEVSMISSLNYTDFLYRPRRPEELDTKLGGGILFNQVPHQVDIARLLANSPVRSVRAMTNILDAQRPTEGGCMALIDFASGASASIIYSGYDRFDSDELHYWVNEIGQEKVPSYGAARRNLKTLENSDAERQARSERGYGTIKSVRPAHQPHFGFTIVSCERGDLRQSADGLILYSDDGATEIAIPPNAAWPGYGDVLDELNRVVRLGEAPVHSGEFGRETVEVCLAILRSSQERREVSVSGTV